MLKHISKGEENNRESKEREGERERERVKDSQKNEGQKKRVKERAIYKKDMLTQVGKRNRGRNLREMKFKKKMHFYIYPLLSLLLTFV